MPEVKISFYKVIFTNDLFIVLGLKVVKEKKGKRKEWKVKKRKNQL